LHSKQFIGAIAIKKTCYNCQSRLEELVVFNTLIKLNNKYTATTTLKLLFFFSVCLRLQANPQNKAQFSDISPERGFADFIFAHIVLHLTIINFIG